MTKLNWMTKVCGVFLLWATAAVALPAQTFTTLYSFCPEGGLCPNGAGPEDTLVQGTDGNLYGTAYIDGANGVGTIFKISATGTLSTLYNFCSQGGCTDGEYPCAGLVQGTDGNFYGSTLGGGAYSGGTLFTITPTGKLTTLHSFDITDGNPPYSTLIQGIDRKFYGTATTGGANNAGTVFTVTSSGTFETLHNFSGTDGSEPLAVLVQGTTGDFYGTAQAGGPNGHGTVFSVTAGGALTVLHSFDNFDGAEPTTGVIQATDGSFYGTTAWGGANGDGTVFKLTQSGTLTTLYSFCSLSKCADGFGVHASLIQATDGNFYGATLDGGANGFGTIFKVTSTGTLTTLHSFCTQESCADGEDMLGGLIQDTNGKLYGAPATGGANMDGTVFSLSVGLRQFVKPQPTSGPVGGTVRILGTDLTGATSVTFNGTAATFTVNSHSLITAAVPAGATTGKVQVTVPSGTLSSNVPFTVRP